MKKIVSVFLALLLAASLCGCGGLLLREETGAAEESPRTDAEGQSIGEELAATYAADHIFSLNCVTDASYNPYLTSSAWNKVVGMLVYENLVEEDESFCAQPNLITAWETEDGRNWTFYVDTGRVFHDGGVMTSLDAVYSINMAMNYNSPYSTRFRYVQGVYTLDNERFTVELGRTNYRFYELLNIPCIEYGTGYNDQPVGTGPYAFSGSGRYLTLNKNHPLADEMPLETVHLKEYANAVDILQAFEDSYVDVVINDPNGMASMGYSSTNIIKYVNTSSMHYLGYNMSSRLFGQDIYREIITYAIDRASIVSDVMKGAGAAATVPVAPQSPLYPESYARTLEYSDSGFRTALRNVGAEDVNGDGVLEFGGQSYTVDFLVCSDSGTKVAAARAIAKKLSDLGFDISLHELAYDDYLTALRSGDFDIYYAEVRLCADWDLTMLLATDGSLNYGNIWDMQLDEYMRLALASDSEGRQEALETLYEYIGRYAYITPICFEKTEVLYHRGVLSGLSPTQDNIFHGIENWTVELG